MKRSSLTVVLRRYEKTSQTMPSLSPSHRPHRCTARIKTGDLLSCSAGGAMLASRSKQGSSLVYQSRGRPGHNGSPHRYHEILVCALNLASSRKCPKAMLGEAWQPVARQAEPSPVQKHRHALGDSPVWSSIRTVTLLQSHRKDATRHPMSPASIRCVHLEHCKPYLSLLQDWLIHERAADHS